ncbi:TadE/TadG family type IV pilus assembly protein [Rhizobium sp. C1]|uniref:TadE/TadG family type IV pilus assembly protein n=1 Tax=Rhizobium sp. C1 TaxID=1349799 RepID=UPI001E29FAEE|nr:TadE/TadG family type IV pilus assembly protein [Rhizobium sp. C1]MCD2176985.1 pilus assembly protein [Rhizobium sp. C1]
MTSLSAMSRRRDGASAVEFAILAPIFIAALFSMIGYAIYLSASASIQQMTEEAARAAVAGLSAQEREQLAQNAVAMSAKDRAFIDARQVKVTISGQDTDRYTIQVSYDAAKLPVWSLFAYAVPGMKTISRTSVMRVGGA